MKRAFFEFSDEEYNLKQAAFWTVHSDVGIRKLSSRVIHDDLFLVLDQMQIPWDRIIPTDSPRVKIIDLSEDVTQEDMNTLLMNTCWVATEYDPSKESFSDL